MASIGLIVAQAAGAQWPAWYRRKQLAAIMKSASFSNRKITAAGEKHGA